MTTSIRVEGLEELRRKLGALAANQALAPEMGRALERVRAPLVKYPLKPTFQGLAALMTPKQRRWFFANLRAGRIHVPYVRTEALGKSWTAVTNATAAGLIGIVGTVIKYARWVQDKNVQAKIHQGRWPTAQDVLGRVTPAIIAGFQREIERLLRTP